MTDPSTNLDPTFELQPMAIIAWDSDRGLWHVGLGGLPTVDYQSDAFESLEQAIAWGRAHAPRVVAQDPDLVTSPEVRDDDAELIERIRRQQTLPTTAHEPIRNLQQVDRGILPGIPTDGWYLVDMWEPGTDPEGVTSWRIGLENQITDVLLWVAERLERRTWALHLITTTDAGTSTATELFGHGGPGYALDNAPRDYLP